MRTAGGRRALAPALALVLAATVGLTLTPTPAHASAAPEVGVGLTPSVVEQDLTQKSFTVRYTIFNQQSRSQGVTLSVEGVAHDLDGTPSFGGDPAGGASVHVSEPHVSLAPGERHAFTVTGAIPRSRGGLDVGVVATLDRAAGATDNGVEVQSRVGALLLLRGPRPWKETLAAEAVDVIGADGAAHLAAVVRNTGDVHQRPNGTIRVLRDGLVVGTATLVPQLVLPGSARRLEAKWVGAVPRGLDQATFDVVLGPSVTRITKATPIAPGSGGVGAGGNGAAGRGAHHRSRAWLWIAGLLLLLALGGLWFVLWKRRRRREAD